MFGAKDDMNVMAVPTGLSSSVESGVRGRDWVEFVPIIRARASGNKRMV